MKVRSGWSFYTKHLLKLSYTIGGASLFLMAVITLLDVIGSKMFHRPLMGSYEAVSLLQLVAIALGGAVALKEGKHVYVDILVESLGSKLRKVITISVNILSIFLFSVFTVVSFDYGTSLYKSGEVTGTVKIPLFPFAYILSFSGLLMIIALIEDTVSLILKKRG